MATFTSAPNKEYYVRLIVNQTSQNIANNTSTVSWELWVGNGVNTMQYNGQQLSASINGKTVHSSTQQITLLSKNMTVKIASGTETISHNADGTKTIACSGQWIPTGSYAPSTTLTASGSLPLTTIPRASSITSVGNTSYGSTVPIVIARNSTSFTHDVTVALPGKSMTITGVGTSTSPTIPIDWLTGYPSGSSASGTVTVQTKSGSTNIGASVSKAFTCSVPGASSFTVANTSYGSEIKATITRKRSEYTHAVTFDLPGNKASFSNVATSQAYTIPLSWLNQYTSGPSATATTTVHTYYGTRLIGSSTKTCAVSVPSNIVPTVSIARTALNSGLAGFDYPIQGISTMTLTRTAGGAYGSTITKTEWWGDGINPSSSSAVSFTAMVKNPQYIYCKVTDSRGRTAQVTYTSWNHAYSPPSMSVTAYRCNSSGVADNEGQYIMFTQNFTVQNVGGSGLNTVSSTIAISGGVLAQTTLSNPSSGTLRGPIGDNKILKTSAYTLTITLTDKVGKTTTATANIPVSEVLMNFPSSANALGIGMYSQGANRLDVGWNTDIKGALNVSRAITTDSMAYLKNGLYMNNNAPIQAYNGSGVRGTIMRLNAQNELIFGDPSINMGRAGYYLGSTWYEALTTRAMSMDNTNMDSIMLCGTYQGYTGMTNAPVQDIAVMEVMAYSNDWVLQRFTQILNNYTWQRIKARGTTWSGWARIN